MPLSSGGISKMWPNRIKMDVSRTKKRAHSPGWARVNPPAPKLELSISERDGRQDLTSAAWATSCAIKAESSASGRPAAAAKAGS